MKNIINENLVFKALSHEKRREILDLLKEKGKTTGQICLVLKNLDRCTVMQHLRALERADLIIVKKHGRERWNYLNALPIKLLLNGWMHQYLEAPIEELISLKNRLES